jgi:DNA polymerase I-like protein with 3'-5' exonuclease and polymerase domains
MIVEMRRRGIRVDLDYADQLRGEFRNKRDEVLKELSRKIGIGRTVTIDDVRQASFKQRLFDAENIPYPRTERGAPSFEAKKMVHLQHWLPKILVEVSQYNDAGEKFISKYIENYAHLGRIHAEIHTTKDIEEGEGGGTATTRLAYSDPPLQQIPSRHPEIGPAIRRIFLPDENDLWAAIDLSQQEFRLITHLASVCKMPGAEDAVKIYNENPNADFHNIVVEITGLPRRTAKDVNFARAYRAGVAKFAQMINKNEDEAKLIYEQYDAKMPFVSRTAEFCDSRAQQKGYLRLIDGARAHFDRWESRWVPKEKYLEALRNNVPVSPCSLDEAKRRCNDPSHPWFQTKLRRAFCYKAMNKWVQSSAARQTKIAMRNCWREKIVPLIQLHDELGVSCRSPDVAEKVAQIMRDAVKLVVPVTTDIEYGNRWGTAKHAKWLDALAA